MAWYVHLPENAPIEQVSSETHPCDAVGDSFPAYDWDRENVYEVDRLGDLEVEMFIPGTGWTSLLEPLKQQALRKIDCMRAEAILPLSTNLAHERKRTELAKYDILLTQDTPEATAELDQLIWLQAEASERKLPLEDVANSIRTQVVSSEKVIAEREGAFVGAKHSIRNATTKAEIDNILTNITTSNEAKVAKADKKDKEEKDKDKKPKPKAS